MAETATCQGCFRDIVWIITTAKKRMPCDAELRTVWLHKDGGKRLVLVTDQGVTESGYIVMPDTAGARQVIGREPHWATCPQRQQFKR